VAVAVTLTAVVQVEVALAAAETGAAAVVVVVIVVMKSSTSHGASTPRALSSRVIQRAASFAWPTPVSVRGGSYLHVSKSERQVVERQGWRGRQLVPLVTCVSLCGRRHKVVCWCGWASL
jgi:hypothetical protein